MNTSFKETFARMFQDEPVKQLERRLKLRARGMSPGDAVILDDAAIDMTRKVVEVIGESLDNVAEHLRQPLSSYGLVVLLSNLSAFSDYLDNLALEVALEEGIPLNVGGYDDNCTCAACTAAREQAAALGRSGKPN